MLLMIGAQSAIIWTSVVCFRVESIRGLRRFVVITDVLIIWDIIRDQDFRLPVLRTTLQHVDLFIFKYDFSIDSLEAFRTET